MKKEIYCKLTLEGNEDWFKGVDMEEEIIKHNKYLEKLVVIRNSISLICFTILAIVFNKWWIVLLSGLFMSYIDKEK